MKFNYQKLKGKITEKYKTQKTFAKMLKINPSTLSQKLSNGIIISTSEVIVYSKKLENNEKSGTKNIKKLILIN